jgi:hypothetical protein
MSTEQWWNENEHTKTEKLEENLLHCHCPSQISPKTPRIELGSP